MTSEIQTVYSPSHPLDLKCSKTVAVARLSEQVTREVRGPGELRERGQVTSIDSDIVIFVKTLKPHEPRMLMEINEHGEKVAGGLCEYFF